MFKVGDFVKVVDAKPYLLLEEEVNMPWIVTKLTDNWVYVRSEYYPDILWFNYNAVVPYSLITQ